MNKQAIIKFKNSKIVAKYNASDIEYTNNFIVAKDAKGVVRYSTSRYLLEVRG